MTLLVALLVACGLALLGYLAGWLRSGGVIAATAVGGIVLWSGGPPAIVLLALFFLTGSTLTYVRSHQNLRLYVGEHRGRTWRQVVANGGWAAVGALLIPVAPDHGWLMLVGALAAAQADTWGTEIGGRSSRLPRLITSGRPVPTGTSGAVTLLGTAAGLVAAALLGGLAWVIGLSAEICIAAAVAGVLGTLGDSLLGATVQGVYHCDACDTQTERPSHHCGCAARLVRGWRWMDNDVVNLLATGIGAGSALLLATAI